LLLIAQANEMQAIQGANGRIWAIRFSGSRVSDHQQAICRANLRVMRLNDEQEVARAARGRHRPDLRSEL
jgi:hypothetical protein